MLTYFCHTDKILVFLINFVIQGDFLVILSLWRSIRKFKACLKFFGYFANAQYDNMDFCYGYALQPAESLFCKRLKMTIKCFTIAQNDKAF